MKEGAQVPQTVVRQHVRGEGYNLHIHTRFCAIKNCMHVKCIDACAVITDVGLTGDRLTKPIISGT